MGMMIVRQSVTGVIVKMFFRIALTSPFFPNTLASSQEEAIRLRTASCSEMLYPYSFSAASCLYTSKKKHGITIQ